MLYTFTKYLVLQFVWLDIRDCKNLRTDPITRKSLLQQNYKLNISNGTNIVHTDVLGPNFYVDIEAEADTSANKTALWELLL